MIRFCHARFPAWFTYKNLSDTPPWAKSTIGSFNGSSVVPLSFARIFLSLVISGTLFYGLKEAPPAIDFGLLGLMV